MTAAAVSTTAEHRPTPLSVDGEDRSLDPLASLAPRQHFAVLFGDSERATELRVAKHLLATVAEPLSSLTEPTSIAAAAAPLHHAGLVDADELFGSAQSSLNSEQRTRHIRLFECD